MLGEALACFAAMLGSIGSGTHHSMHSGSSATSPKSFVSKVTLLPSSFTTHACDGAMKSERSPSLTAPLKLLIGCHVPRIGINTLSLICTALCREVDTRWLGRVMKSLLSRCERVHCTLVVLCTTCVDLHDQCEGSCDSCTRLVAV